MRPLSLIAVFLTLGSALAAPADMDAVKANLSAVWNELERLNLEISNHHHEGHVTETDHDKINAETEGMQHEHHIHHHHTETEAKQAHPYHFMHHSHQDLIHLDEFHSHDSSNGKSEQDSHDSHSLHAQDNGHYQSKHHAHGHEGGEEHEHEHHAHGHDGGEEHEHEHHVHEQEGGDKHEHEHHVHEHGSDQDKMEHEHFTHEHDENVHTHEHSHTGSHDDRIPLSTEGADHRHHDTHHQDHLTLDDPHHPRNLPAELFTTAYCSMAANTGTPTSDISGNVTIKQSRDSTGPVYFDLDLTGFEAEGKYAIHVHTNAVEGGDCRTTGKHFNPYEKMHGNPTASVDSSHVGDLGNLNVGPEGEIKGYVIADHKVSFSGDENILQRSLVIHMGTDDFGTTGTPASLSSGDAGARIACCNIYQRPSNTRFRFRG